MVRTRNQYKLEEERSNAGENVGSGLLHFRTFDSANRR